MTDTTLTYDDELEIWDREGALDNQHWLAAKACIAKGDKAAAKADDFYITAGQHLKALKAAHDERGGTFAAWEALLRERVGIGKSRASELMQIADGTKTVEGIREATAEKVRQIRAHKSSPVRTGENSGNITTSIDTKGRKQPAKKPPTKPPGAKPADKPRNTPSDNSNKDVAPASSGETERKLARLEELEHENVRLRRENLALRSENEELRARLASRSDNPRAPDDDGLDIPGWLQRSAP
jgi:hypothetical protein